MPTMIHEIPEHPMTPTEARGHNNQAEVNLLRQFPKMLGAINAVIESHDDEWHDEHIGCDCGVCQDLKGLRWAVSTVQSMAQSMFFLTPERSRKIGNRMKADAKRREERSRQAADLKLTTMPTAEAA